MSSVPIHQVEVGDVIRIGEDFWEVHGVPLKRSGQWELFGWSVIWSRRRDTGTEVWSVSNDLGGPFTLWPLRQRVEIRDDIKAVASNTLDQRLKAEERRRLNADALESGDDPEWWL